MLLACTTPVAGPACHTRTAIRTVRPGSAFSSFRPCSVARRAQLSQQQRQCRQSLQKVHAASDSLAGEPEPDTAKEAIELGNKYAKAGRWQEALAIYERALTLPGTGLKRFRDKPRLISDGERSAALFNLACCHSQLGDARSGLVALAGCLELGYDDFAQLRSDPDLEALRKDERFEGLLKRFEPKKMGGFLGGFFSR